MTEETNGNPATKLLDHYFKTIKENEEFLRRNAGETYGEVIDLINDAIDYMISETEKKESKEDYIRNPMSFFLYHILTPQSYAILTDLLVGNLPACFMELRLMLESMVKCYFASLHPDPDLFFEAKLELLEKVLDEQKISTSKLLKDFGNKIGLRDEPIALWGKLSKDWVHTRGIVKRVVDEIVEKSDVPSWALIIPMHYTDTDLNAINELGKRISQFRKLLKVTIENKNRFEGIEK